MGVDVRAQLSRGALASFAVKLAGIGVGFLAMFIFARVLGVAEFGAYSYVWGWLSLSMIFARLGFDTMVLRFVAGYSSVEDWAQAKRVLVFSLRFTLAAAVAGSLLFLLVAIYHFGIERGNLGWVFAGAAIVLPVIVRSSIYQSAIRALKRPGLADFPEMIVRPALAAGFVACWFGIYDPNPDASVAMVGQFVGATAALAVGVLVWRRLSVDVPAAAPDPGLNREWLSVSMPMMLISAFQFALHQMDIVMIGLLIGPAEVGAYVPASRIADLVGFGLVVVSSMVAPMIAGLFAKGDMEALRSTVRLASRMAGLFALAVFLVVVTMRTWLLSLFGPGFTAGETPIVILALGQLLNVLIGPVGYLTTMTGHHSAAGRVVAATACLNLALNLLLIPMLGVNGAAIGTATSLVVSHVFLGIYVWRNLKINPTIVGR